MLSLRLAPGATLGTDLIVGAAPAERAGAASAISETGIEVGGALGVAILGSIGTAVYRNEVTNALPEGIPRQVAEAARATLGGAVTVADQVPASLLAAATDAFADGLRLAAYTNGAAMLVMAVVVLFLLRKATPASPGHDVAAA